MCAHGHTQTEWHTALSLPSPRGERDRLQKRPPAGLSLDPKSADVASHLSHLSAQGILRQSHCATPVRVLRVPKGCPHRASPATQGRLPSEMAPGLPQPSRESLDCLWPPGLLHGPGRDSLGEMLRSPDHTPSSPLPMDPRKQCPHHGYPEAYPTLCV